MKITWPLLLCISVLPWLNGCAHERNEALSNRIDRQDSRIEGRTTRRGMRADAEDRRYNDWYNRVMH